MAPKEPIMNSSKILYKIPSPELHLLLGVVNTIYCEIMKQYPETATRCAKVENLKRHNLYRATKI